MSQQKAEGLNLSVDDDKVIENMIAKRRLPRISSTLALVSDDNNVAKEPPPSPRIVPLEGPEKLPQPLSPRYTFNINCFFLLFVANMNSSASKSSKVDAFGRVIHVCRICEESFPEVLFFLLSLSLLIILFTLLQNLLREHDLLCAIVNKIDAKHLSCDERLDALVSSIKRAISKSTRNSALLELAQIAKGYAKLHLLIELNDSTDHN